MVTFVRCRGLIPSPPFCVVPVWCLGYRTKLAAEKLSKLWFAFQFFVMSGTGGDKAWALFSGPHFTWVTFGSLDLHT